MAINVGSVAVSVVPSAEGFREKLDAQLANLTAHVRIVLEDNGADLKIDEVKAKLDTIHDKTVNVRVNDNGSASSLSGIDAAAGAASAGAVAKIAVIGTALLALIPLAAAASIAIAGIGAGIGAGIAGLLVGGLALTGVSGALSAKKTPGSGGSGGSGQSAAQAAETAARNANSQRQAEIQLTVAQRDAAQAQRDLTQARVDAVQNLQDLTNSVADNALAQRKAVLDLQAAKTALDTAKANPDSALPANQAALAGLQLGYDQAKQSLTELQERGTQLAQQKAVADAAGVAGAANVVAAQNKVVDTQNAVTQAQFQVADSARQAALGQQAAAGGASAYQTAMNKLNPAQQQFVQFLQSLKPEFDILKTATTNSFLPLLQQAITNLLPLVGPVSQIITSVGTAFGQLAVQASQALTGPFWTQFLTFVATNLGPALLTAGKIVGSIFEIAASAFQQAYPLIKSFGDAISTALGSASGNVQGGALNGFFAYIKDNAPQIQATLKTVGEAIGSILKSLAPLGGPALKAIGDIAKDFAELVKYVAPVVKALLPFAPLILGAVVAFQALAAILPVINALMALNPWVLLAIAVVALGVALYELYQHSQNFRDAVDALGRALLPLWQNVLVPIGQFLIADWKFQFEVAVTAVKGLISAVETIAGALTAAYNGVKDFGTNLVNLIKGIPGAISALAGEMYNAGTSLIDALFRGLSKTGSAVIDFSKAIVNGIIDGLNSILPHHLSGKIPIPAAPDIHFDIPLIPEIPHLFKGGPVIAGQPYVVGDGPGNLGELFVPDQSGRVLSHGDAMAAAALASRRTGDTHIQVNEVTQNPVATAWAINRRLQFA